MKNFLIFQEAWDKPEKPAYDIYPPKLKEPYRTSRIELGEQMYKIIGIQREDKEARISKVMKNFKIFGDTCAFFCFGDRQLCAVQGAVLG